MNNYGDLIKTWKRRQDVDGQENTLKGWSDEDEGAGLIFFGAENSEYLLQRPALEKGYPLPFYWHNIHDDRPRRDRIPSCPF